MTTTPSTCLLVIDPQNDFCDLPDRHLPTDPLTGRMIRPSLPVAGAHEDLSRLAGFVQRHQAALDQIVVTLDSHQRIDIAHPGFWQARAGDVLPFTPILAAQVRAGEFLPRDPAALPRTLAYLDALEAAGRYTLMVWPVHCQIGSWGHGLHANLRAAFDEWELTRVRALRHVFKGTNPWTEHYSALLAEVPDAADPKTQLNQELLGWLDEADRIVIAGQASSHCVKSTVEHLVEFLPRPQRLTLLTDCMSPVQGFQAQHDAFMTAMSRAGVTLTTSEAWTA
ncbi:MAG: cysteine hydrolase [Burkholderiaceae bacterium]